MPVAPASSLGVWFARVDAAEPCVHGRMPALDRYSFPSGHTLHAVSFTLQACLHFPQLARVLVPLALALLGLSLT